ncbi:serine/threonine-protein phosphatase 6 regulatory ankyrin repeat subunit a-like [Plakobranchus ocellatus]|uniref:Serine/threonine-protein phosphatase 6 regulatory ankyrin repeat subunit a-like n=1 Tax=Plakobranchus ocellatus TaxID=259542 RepID=A0AAV3YQ96_9GAST|nr:serine/threonine-protein phosphatase 6 regulatory ankyrin repeat subunit a-like [Plakobranchus ocellatus]
MSGFLSAVRSGRAQELHSILELYKLRGNTPSLEDVHCALLCASKAGNLQCVQHLLTVDGIDPNHKDDSGNSSLYLVVKGNHSDIVSVLCENGASVDSIGSGNCTPLHLAARHGFDDCLEALLQFNCNVDAKDSTGSTALMLAVRWKQYVAISLLLEHGCDVNARDCHGRTALHYGCHTAVAVEKLIQAGADVNARDADECTPLLMAATEGLEGVVNRLCEAPGIDVNIPNKGAGKTPLHILAQKGHAKSVCRLVLSGADINLLDTQGRSPLYYAVARSRCDVTATLLKANGRVDTYQCPSNTSAENCPVHLAAESCLTTILKLFILSGYDNQHVRQIVSKPNIKELFTEEMIQHWLDHANDVSSLRHLCRMWLRHHLDVRLYSDLSKLNLPDKIREYILMSELDDLLLR